MIKITGLFYNFHLYLLYFYNKLQKRIFNTLKSSIINPYLLTENNSNYYPQYESLFINFDANKKRRRKYILSIWKV